MNLSAIASFSFLFYLNFSSLSTSKFSLNVLRHFLITFLLTFSLSFFFVTWCALVRIENYCKRLSKEATTLNMSTFCKIYSSIISRDLPTYHISLNNPYAQTQNDPFLPAIGRYRMSAKLVSTVVNVCVCIVNFFACMHDPFFDEWTVRFCRKENNYKE